MPRLPISKIFWAGIEQRGFTEMMKNFKQGFTLIELLVVVSIIGLLAGMILVSMSGARAKARDARRAADMRQILNAINMFYNEYDCLPITTGSTCAGAGSYSECNSGCWDYSSQGGFMTFLANGGFLPRVVDPVNNMTGDGSPAGSLAYRYYCYADGPSLGYWKESGYSFVTIWSHNGNFVCR